MVEIVELDNKCYTQNQAKALGVKVDTFPDEYEPNKLVRDNQIYVDTMTGNSWGTGLQLINRRSGPTGSNQGVTMRFFQKSLSEEYFTRTFQNTAQDNWVILPGTILKFYASDDYKNRFSYFIAEYHTGDGGVQQVRVFDFLRINFDPYQNRPEYLLEFSKGTILAPQMFPTIEDFIIGDFFTIEGAIEYNYNY